MLLHASCVALSDKAVLIAGPPGSGKSDLALRLIDAGAQLIADDQTELQVIEQRLIAFTPASIAGLMEVSHMGLMKLPFVGPYPVALYVDLVGPAESLDRLPEKESVFFLDQAVPRLRLPSFAASTPAKIRSFLLYPSVTDD